jgi:PTH1 family peptidyl-tRNA hydrolase
MSEPWLIAGLGNPGERYARTRHNAGAMVVEELCRRFGVRPKKVRLVSILEAEARHESEQLLLVMPTTFMNECGPPIASFARKKGVSIDHIVACHDDIDLAFGALRIKRGGSTAGHHGLDSMVAALHAPDFSRVRLGVGRPQGRWENIDFLLTPFAKAERDDAAILVQHAAEAVLSLVTEGLSVTQSRYTKDGVREA